MNQWDALQDVQCKGTIPLFVLDLRAATFRDELCDALRKRPTCQPRLARLELCLAACHARTVTQDAF